ncbi:MAG: cytochrome c [Phycisphaerae bacterium]|nr:cytochrome c [Phycisphaerae bacterium]
MKHYSTIRMLTTVALGAACAAGLSGCRGDREAKPPRQFFPDLDDAPKWKPQSGSEFFADGRTMRPRVQGAVAFSRVALSEATLAERPAWAAPHLADREALLAADQASATGRDAAGEWLVSIPIAVDKAMVLEGMERFDIYCAVCHGYMGDGKGMVGQQWAYPLPSFHDEKYFDAAQQTGRDGYLFNVSRVGVVGPDGVAKMPGYAHALSERESWAIVAYVRALQQSRRGTLADLTEQERGIVQRQWGVRTSNAGGNP